MEDGYKIKQFTPKRRKKAEENLPDSKIWKQSVRQASRPFLSLAGALSCDLSSLPEKVSLRVNGNSLVVCGFTPEGKECARLKINVGIVSSVCELFPIFAAAQLNSQSIYLFIRWNYKIY